MEINIMLANKENAYIIKNIYPLYLYDIAEIYKILPNKYGIFETEPVKTLIEQYEIQNIWFEKPGVLFPFIIYVDNNPAGFALVGSGKYAPKECDYYMYDYFVLRPYRGNKVAENAANQVFNKFKGKWLVYTNPTENNPIGRMFWRRTIKNYTNDNYEEREGNTFDGEKLIFSFNS